MIILTVAQEKGGVGKSTLAKLLSEFFANQGFRMLLMDADPQGNVSARFIPMESDSDSVDGYRPPVNPDYDQGDPSHDGVSPRSSIADVYGTGKVLTYTATNYPNIEVIPSSGNRIREVELVQRSELEKAVHHRVIDWFAVSGIENDIDIVIIDTPPNKGPVTYSLLLASTHLLIPAKMEHSTIEGLRGMIQLWRQINRDPAKRAPLILAGLVPNFVRKVALHEGIMASLKNDDVFADFLTDNFLAERIAYAEVEHPSSKVKSIFGLPANDAARKEATALCREIQERLGL